MAAFLAFTDVGAKELAATAGLSSCGRAFRVLMCFAHLLLTSTEELRVCAKSGDSGIAGMQ
jgi:hypothetical protein